MICSKCGKYIDKIGKFSYVTCGGELLCNECAKKYKRVKKSL